MEIEEEYESHPDEDCRWCGKKEFEDDLGQLHDYSDFCEEYEKLYLHKLCFTNGFFPQYMEKQRKKEEEEKKIVEENIKMQLGFKKKAKFRKLVQFLILPFAIILPLLILIAVKFHVSFIGIFLFIGILYIVFLILTLILQSLFELNFGSQGGAPFSYGFKRSIIINALCFIIVSFIIFSFFNKFF